MQPEWMMRSLSQDLRERFLDAVVAGASARAAGRRFALSPTTAIRWAKAWRAHGAEQQRSRVDAQRQAWFEGQIDLEPERLIFIDETGASTKMARRYGRAPKGERCRA